VDVEHPTGFFTVEMDVAVEQRRIEIRRSALLRTARKLMRGEVFVPGRIWSGK
jgi:4-oxalomesaconate tautomerase